MKRINPQTNQPYRCGDINPHTGMIFRAYNKTRTKRDGYYVELWLHPDSFNAIRDKMRNDARARRKALAFRRTKTTEQLIADLYKPAA